jgi:hypothetical protein
VSKAGAGFRSLADAWADTTTAHGRLRVVCLDPGQSLALLVVVQR